MARQTQNPQPENRPASAEINPLLDPILSQNLERWAEVYFTTLPEKRHEAIQALRRELQEEKMPQNSARSGGPSEFKSTTEAVEEPIEHAEQEDQEHVSVCHSCGELNPLVQRFCGMCGEPLQNSFLQEESPGAETGETDWDGYQQEAFSEDSNQTEDPEEAASEMVDERPIFSAYSDSRYQYRRQDVFVEPEASRETSDGVPMLFSEYKPVSYRFRIYVGIILAALIGGLVYMAWKSMRAASGEAQLLPAVSAPAQTGGEAGPNDAAASTKAEPEAGGAGTNGENASRNSDGSADKGSGEKAEPPEKASLLEREKTAGESSVKAANSRKRGKESSGAAEDAVAANAGDSGDATSGSQDLAVAKTFLDGTNGRARDSREAAKWLWQAVRQQNGPATLMLADLYLHGDGVAKSCDEGRLLLYAAARKGVAGAGERLRNLPAFGCQ